MSKFHKFMLSANWPKTIAFNLRMFPLRQAIHLPVLLFGNVDIRDCKGGNCEFIEDIPFKDLFAQVCIGNVFCQLHGRNVRPYYTRLSIKGTLQFGKMVFVSGGGLIFVGKDATLSIGDSVYIGPKVKIDCWEHIQIGNLTSFSWECQIFDTNVHYVISKNGVVHKHTKPITLEHNVWIGNRSTIGPGAALGAYSILASNSLLNIDYSGIEAGLFAGVPAKLKKEGCYSLKNNLIENKINEWFDNNRDQSECHIAMQDELFQQGVKIF